MKVKDLKALLEGVDENGVVLFQDVNGDLVDVIHGQVSKDGDLDCVYLNTRQEFPETWYRNGKEIRRIGNGVIPVNTVDNEEMELVDKEFFGDNNGHPVLLEIHDGYAKGDGVYLTFPKLGELSDDEIREIDKYTCGRISESGYVTPYDVCLQFGKIEKKEGEGIMDTTNGHAEKLVNEINEKWDKYRVFFKPILCALYERDMEEIYNSDSFQFDGSMDDALEAMCREWYFHAYNYLMHIADDQDLDTILAFVRYDVVEDYN